MTRSLGLRRARLLGLTAVGLGLVTAYPRYSGEWRENSARCPHGCPEVLDELVVAALRDEPPPTLRLPGFCNDAQVTVFYDAASRPLRAEQDCNRDGRTDRWEELSADGSTRRIEIDRDFDGTVDVVEPAYER